MFRSALNVDRDFSDARFALEEIQRNEKREVKKWIPWWFDAGMTLKALPGVVIIGLITYLVAFATYVATFLREQVENSVFVLIVVAIGILLLPSLTKINIANIVELEMKSVGKE